MKVSVIIPSLANDKTLPYLQACVNSIRKNAKEQPEIKVIINGGNMVNPKVQASISYIRPQGQCQAVNAAMKEVTTEYVIVTDDDSMWPKGWEQILENTPEFDVVAFNSMEPGRVGAAPPFITHPLGETLEEFNQERFEQEAIRFSNEEKMKEPSKYTFDEKRPWLEYGFSYPFLVKKELWDRVGGYDEKYDPWGSNSDSDLMYKFTLAGHRPVRDRRVINYHFSQLSGTFLPEQGDFWQQNRRYFVEKWGFERAASPEIWYKVDIPHEKRRYKPSWQKEI